MESEKDCIECGEPSDRVSPCKVCREEMCLDCYSDGDGVCSMCRGEEDAE